MSSLRAAVTPFALAAACLACVPALAANLQISPVSITFKAGQGAAGITLQNQGDTPVYGQVRAYAWAQPAGEDALTDTTELVVSPPIIEIAPRATQTIRLVLRAPAAGSERTYRLLIDEIPRDTGPESGVDIRLRYSVPVFVPPVGDAAPVLAWKVVRAEGEWKLTVSNTGTLHAQLGTTTFRNAAGREYEISKGLLGYVLPGQQRTWKLAVDKDAELDGKLAVQTTVNARPEAAEAAGSR